MANATSASEFRLGGRRASVRTLPALGLLLCSLGASAATATAHIGVIIIRPVDVHAGVIESPTALPLAVSVTTTTEGMVVNFN
jgi:hypothetical protein